METLSRFISAQEEDYPRALKEIRNGRKESHWMWYIFPQYKGLGYSPTARCYAIQSREEGLAYCADPVLFPRLKEISSALLALSSSDITEILGSPDDLKLQSSMTLFYALSGEPVFRRVLEKFYGGKEDPATLRLLEEEA